MRFELKRDGLPVEAVVTASLQDAVAFVAAEWPPGLAGEEDADWDPRSIVSEHPAGEDNTHIVVHCAGQVQGYAVLQHRRAWRSLDFGEEAPYLAYAAAAPWNRMRNRVRVDARHPRCTPIGQILVTAAITASVELGQNGRFAFHSLPLAEPWYVEQLPDAIAFGPDYDGERYLPYYEVSAAAATAFLARSTIRPY